MAALAPRLNHIPKGIGKGLLAILVLQGVEKKQSLFSGVRFLAVLLRVCVRRNRRERPADDFTSHLWAFDSLASECRSKYGERGHGRLLLPESWILPVTQPARRERRRSGNRKTGRARGKIHQNAVQ